jgi:uncharacterized ParB-like nuclease family protein
MPSILSQTQIGVGIKAQLTGGTAPAITRATIEDEIALTPGVGSGSDQANKIYSAAMNLNTAAPTTLDLSNLTDPLGASITFTKVQAILIRNKATTATHDITVESSGSNPLIATDVPITLKAGGKAVFFTSFGGAGLTVDSTHKNLDLAAAAGSSVPITITILGS